MKITPIYNKKPMEDKLNSDKLRKLVKEMMTRTFNVNEDDDDLGIYGTGFDSHEFDNDAMQAAMADIKSSGGEFEPLGSSKFEKNLDVDAMKQDLSRANLDLPSDKEKTKKTQQTLDKRYKHEKLFGKGSLNEEFESDPEEGPQPGDLEYHQNPPSHQKGLGEFKHIDWQMLHEIFAANTEFHNTGKVEGNPKYMEAGVNDLLDDGFLSPEELDLLENRGIIEIVGHYPILSDDKFLQYNTFHNAAKEAWEKGFDNSGLNQDHNVEAPYMRGRELDEHTDFDMTNLYKFLKDAMEYVEDNGLDYAQGAELLEKALIHNFNITKKNKINFSMNETPEATPNPNVNADSKIDRPKDAEGQPLTIRARVEDVDTGMSGRVIRFGIDDNGNQTVHVDWAYNFGDPILKQITYPKKVVVRDENRIVREDGVEEGEGHSFTVGKGQNAKPSNYPQNLKRNSLIAMHENFEVTKEEKENIEEVYVVLDNDFNRAHYKELIGKEFNDVPPAYAQTKVINKEEYDFAAAERQHHDEEKHEESNSEMLQVVPEELQKFVEPNSFQNTALSYSFELDIPKQSDETSADVERFVNGELNAYKSIALYTELEKISNKWIIKVTIHK